MKRKTNTEFVTELMNYSPCGALMQAFVLEALHAYSTETLAAEPWAPNAVVNQDAWKACASQILKALEERR